MRPRPLRFTGVRGKGANTFNHQGKFKGKLFRMIPCTSEDVSLSKDLTYPRRVRGRVTAVLFRGPFPDTGARTFIIRERELKVGGQTSAEDAVKSQ